MFALGLAQLASPRERVTDTVSRFKNNYYLKVQLTQACTVLYFVQTAHRFVEGLQMCEFDKVI